MFLNLTTASPTYIPGVGTGAVWMWCRGASPCDLPNCVAVDARASLARRVGASAVLCSPHDYIFRYPPISALALSWCPPNMIILPLLQAWGNWICALALSYVHHAIMYFIRLSTWALAPYWSLTHSAPAGWRNSSDDLGKVHSIWYNSLEY